MLIDGTDKIVERCPVGDLEYSLSMFDCLIYDGAEGRIPRFKK